MPPQVTLLPTGHIFTVQGNDTLLESALRAGHAPNYGCSSGNCGLCKARVVSGHVEKVAFHDYVMPEIEKAMGFVLMCSHSARTDLVIEAGEARTVADIPRQRVVARTRRVEHPAPHIVVLHLQTPRIQRLRFLAGQSVTLSLTGKTGEFPIASCPCDDRNLQFHIPRAAMGAMRSGDVVTIEGPHGAFTFEDDGRRPLVFVAWELGFAPIKSLIEHVMALDDTRAMELYWFGRSDNAHYMNNLCRSWTDALDNFRYIPVTLAADETASEAFARVTPVAVLDEIDLYFAGPADVVAAARAFFPAHGVSAARVRVTTVAETFG